MRHENQIETEYPVGVTNRTNEEGARFPISMVPSGVWAGEIPLEKAHKLLEIGASRQTIEQALQSISYLGVCFCGTLKNIFSRKKALS